VRLQAVLNGTFIAEILPAKALGVTGASLVFPWCTLRHCDWKTRNDNCNGESQSDHRNLILTMQGSGLNRPRRGRDENTRQARWFRKCRYAEFYKELGETELGFLLVCTADGRRRMRR
jgi:hypothetical protein